MKGWREGGMEEHNGRKKRGEKRRRTQLVLGDSEGS